jgi:O-antigen biosynthesis protein WbqP
VSKRVFDVVISIFVAGIFLTPFLLIVVVVKLTSSGSVFYWSKRVGQNSELFLMPKFRTMRVGTPEVATDKLEDPDQYLTVVGKFLRRTSLDELPQLISVFQGNMSIVGPRPALYTQDDLIDMRRKMGIDTLMPGITGWAQVNGRDEVDLDTKIDLDNFYLENKSLWLDVKIIFHTGLAVLGCKDITH